MVVDAAGMPSGGSNPRHRRYMIREGVELGRLGKGLQNEAWLDKRATFRLQRAEPFQAGTERTMRLAACASRQCGLQ